MNLFLQLPKLLRFLLIFIPSLTLLYVVMRIAFYIIFSDPMYPLMMNDLVKSMWLGLRFDLRMVVLMIIPLFALGGIKWFSPFKYKFARNFWLVYISAVFAFYFMFYVVDFGHYAYLNTRLDFTAMRFAENAAISSQMVWESYPVIWISVAIVFANLVFIFLTHKLFLVITKQKDVVVSLKKGILLGFIAFFVLLVAGYSKFSQYPLRWSEAAFSKYPFATQLTYNPIHYFFDTWKNGRITYDKTKVAQYYPIVSEYLGVKGKNAKELYFQRAVTPKHPIGEKPNVVIVILESFASYKSSLSANPLDPSPHVKELAQNGYFFKNFFTPSTGTARSIYTTVTGLPDVELKGTSSRNPLIVNQHSVAQDFDGYDKAYFIGGSASWGNIRGMLSQSLNGLKLYEEGDYSSPRNDVWGISDIDLFREANKALVTMKEPFLSVIQTSGNHRPYTIPNDSYGFESRTDISDKEVLKYGFDSVEEYNSFRFMDYSVGHFMDLARKSEYYKNTIFIFWGDHGISGRTGQHTFVGESTSKLGLGSYRVPFIIYSPLIKEPKVFEKVLSEVDALPTIASMANISYTATTLGRDAFDKSFDKDRYAFTIYHKPNPTIGLIGEKYYYRTKADGTDAALFDIYSDTPLKDHSLENKELVKKMKDLTYGIYETAKYIPYFNKQEDVK
ncbi:LTA synthase family protein [Sulfurimonas sp.]|uniref:LTA synthase family protein n=1 Tax=Sulfurimonas sp. TaxID=2022749 RepID=UPI0025DF4219|nr:alkaline phosphatase family protein [Sulfurimonas sp.]